MFLWELHIFTLRLRASGKIEDTRRYMKYLYLYWYHKGYWGAITSSLVDFLNMFIVFTVALIFTVCFHWDAALECVDAQCSETSMTGGVALPHLFHRSVLGYTAGITFFVTSLVACAYEGVKFVQTLLVEYEVEEIVRRCGINTGYLTLLHKWRRQWRERKLRSRCDAYHSNRRECVTLRTSHEPLLTTMGWGEFVEMMCETIPQVQNVNNNNNNNSNSSSNVVKSENRDGSGGSGSNTQNMYNGNINHDSYHVPHQPSERERLNTSWNSSLSSRSHQTSNVHLSQCANDGPLDVLHAIQGLLHIENYMIALYESGILDQHALQYVREQTLKTLLSVMFDPFHTLLPFHQCLWALRGKVVQLWLLHLCFYPFIATYCVMKMLVKHAAQFKANYRDFSRREWNTRARYTFRLYNEVHHLHACRLVNGNEVAREMVERLAVSNSLSRFMRRLSSTVVLISVVLSFTNPSLLIHGYMMNLSIIWWLTLALVVYATFNDEDPREREYVYHTDLERLSDAIHFAEPVWFDSGEAFLESITTRYLRSRLYLITRDLCQTLMLPYTLFCLLTDGSLELLAQTVEDISVFEEGVGSVAEGAVFNEEDSSILLLDNTIRRKKIGHGVDRHMTRDNLNTNEMTLIDHATDKVKSKRSEANHLNHCRYEVESTANGFVEEASKQVYNTDKLLTFQVQEETQEMSANNENAKMLRRKYSIASFAAVYPHWRQRQLYAQLSFEHQTMRGSEYEQMQNVASSDAAVNESMMNSFEHSDHASSIVDENDNGINYKYREEKEDEERQQQKSVDDVDNVCSNKCNAHETKSSKESVNTLHSSLEQTHTHDKSTLHVPALSSLVRDANECAKEAVCANECKIVNENTKVVDKVESPIPHAAKIHKTQNERANKIDSPNATNKHAMHKQREESQSHRLPSIPHNFHSQIVMKGEVHNELLAQDTESNSSDSESSYETDSQYNFSNNEHESVNNHEVHAINGRGHKYDHNNREKCAKRSSNIHLSRHSLDPQRSTAHEREQLFVSQVRSMMQLQRQQPKSMLTSYRANEHARRLHDSRIESNES